MVGLVRWTDPFRELSSLRRDIDRLFRETLDDRDGRTLGWMPPVDIVEDEHSLVIKAEIPGMKRDDIKVEVEGGVLTISGERSLEKEESGKTYHFVERSYGQFMRSFTLPTKVDPNKIDAKYADGVLEISLAKREEAKPKTISVK